MDTAPGFMGCLPARDSVLMTPSPLVRFEDVSYCPPGVSKNILEAISLTLYENEIITVIGPNGAGKTSLLTLLVGLTPPTTGKIWKRPALRLGYVPQKIDTHPFFPMTVQRFLQMAQVQHILSEKIDVVLERFHVRHLKNRQLSDLSGGERQRVFLARALLRAPDLLILDEPTQGIDVAGQALFYKTLETIHEELRCAVLLVSHDLHCVMAASHKIICLNTHICCSGFPEDIAKNPAYEHLFGITPTIGLYTHHHDHSHDH